MADTLPCPSPIEIDDRSAAEPEGIHERDAWTREENVALALHEQESR